MVSSKKILKEITSLRNKKYLPQGYIAFHGDLFQRQLETKDKLLHDNVLENFNPGNVEQKLKAGVHILDLDRIQSINGPLVDLVDTICRLIEKHGKWDASKVKPLKQAVEKNRLNVQTLMTKAALKDSQYFESLSESLGVEAEILYYMGIQVGKPLFELLAESVEGKIGRGLWTGGFCPVCGQEPAIAKIEREEGHRILHCWLCNTEWPFRRLQCPFCLNDDHETLRFFYFDEVSPYRVDVCDVCKRYLKTVDERKLNEEQRANLEVESIHTIFLDIIAIDEGYSGSQTQLLNLDKESVPTS